MNLKTIYLASKRHFAVLLFLSMSYASAVVYLWDQYRGIQIQLSEINQAQLKLSEDKIQFEKYRSEELQARFSRESALQKRELIADQLAKRNSAAEEDLKRREATYLELVGRLNSEQQKLGASAERQAAEIKLQSLMSEFAALGVSLSSKPCGDAEAIKKYNTAKAKYDEIYSWAEAHSLDEKYRNFLFHNQQTALRFCGD
ncbi:hypothetical protein [Pseudomonas sp. COR18]|uniref:hypothetical protein n=1 Tax=Pseudomonas sp. COR18 TaxID=3399680 RepID=UPI003B00C1CB